MLLTLPAKLQIVGFIPMQKSTCVRLTIICFVYGCQLSIIVNECNREYFSSLVAIADVLPSSVSKILVSYVSVYKDRALGFDFIGQNKSIPE